MKQLKKFLILFLLAIQFVSPLASDPIGYKHVAPDFIPNNLMLVFGSKGFERENSKSTSFKPFAGIELSEKIEAYFGYSVLFSLPTSASVGAGDKPNVNFASGFTFSAPIGANLEMFRTSEIQDFKYQAHVGGYIGTNGPNKLVGVLKIGRKKMENSMFGRLDLRLSF